MLSIYFGEVTKFASYLLGANKTYVANIKLGIITTTYDSDGDIVSSSNMKSIKQYLSTIDSFIGKQSQIPPIYSQH